MKVNRNTSDTELQAITKGLLEQIDSIELQIAALKDALTVCRMDVRECLIRMDERDLPIDENHNMSF